MNDHRHVRRAVDGSCLYVFATYAEAEEAINSLHASGFDAKKLSLIGNGYHSEKHPVGFYTAGNCIKSWSRRGAFWGGTWGLLFAPAIFLVPELGLIAMAGPVVAALVGTMERDLVVDGLSVVGTAMATVGIPMDQAIECEIALKADKYVLMVHGNAEEVAQARSALMDSRSWETA